MILGFTGTRHGMRPAQRAAFRALLARLGPTQFHHGDCVGADAEAHEDAVALSRVHGCTIVIHPPIDPQHRAGCVGAFERAAKTHFARNREIVHETDLLIGISVADVPLDRGGTWYTIDYALKRGKPVRVIWPDGHVTEGRLP